MLEKIRKMQGRAMDLVSNNRSLDARPILDKLGRSIWRDSAKGLRTLEASKEAPSAIQSLHIAIDHLTNINVAIRGICRAKSPIGAKPALELLDDSIRQTNDLVRSGVIAGSFEAGEIATRSLNRLFTAKETIKHEFCVFTPLEMPANLNDLNDLKLVPFETCAVLPPPEVRLTSAMIFQLRHSLFPAERMIVGAGRRSDGITRIEALFDVTGAANPAGVKADPDRLGQSLIAMSETDTYFGIWVHSHPGSGPGATYPSSIDLRQHADWLKHYSPSLLSAIMVKDGYIRFWGTALENMAITVAIEGPGIRTISKTENIFRIDS